MKKVFEIIGDMHPLRIMATVGTILFVIGGVTEFARNVPHGLLWLGGGLVVISIIGAISD